MKLVNLGRLLLLSALWGGSFIFMRVAAPALGPILLITLRVLIAGLVLLAFATATGQALELRARWRQYLVIGVVNSALPFVLIATATLQLTAALAAVLNATSPLFGALFAAVWLGDTISLRKAIGIGLGVFGVVVLTGLSLPVFTAAVLLAVAASLVAAASYGLAGTYTRAKVSGAPPLGLAVGSQLAAGLVLLPLVPLALPMGWPSATVVASVLALALFSTALAYLLFFRLVVEVGPMQALTVTFLAPLFSIVWGALFLSEPLGLGTLLGCGLVLAGTALVTGVRLPWAARQPERGPADLAARLGGGQR